MLKGSLRDLVLQIEEGADLDMMIWMSVTGSLLSGRLVSHRMMVRITTEALSKLSAITDQARMSIWSDLLIEKEQELRNDTSEIDNLHMVDVSIFHGDKVVRSPFAIVHLDSIGAWGIGNVAAEN